MSEDCTLLDRWSELAWRIFMGLLSLEALISLVVLWSIPGDTNRAIFLGLTPQRLVLAALLLTAHLVCGWFAYRPEPWWLSIQRRLELPLLRQIAWWGAAILALIFGAASLLPDDVWGRYAAVHLRLLPILVWIALAAFQFLVVLFLQRTSLRSWKDGMNELVRPKFWLPGFVFLLFAGLIFLFAAVWKVGLQQESFWDKPGVPLLNVQVLVSLVAALIFSWLLRRRSVVWERWGNLVVFLIIWALTAVVWLGTPQTHSHFAPGPFPPNEEFYPYSDAMVYDTSAQLGLIGSGMEAGRGYVDKPLYTVFLLWLHALSGGQFSRVIALQVIALAVFPALLYLLGTRLHSQAAGMAAALLAIFKVQNAIGGSLLVWTVSHPKLLMSEFPLAVMLALLTYFLTRWLQNPSRKVYAVAAMGAFTLSTLIRHNSWLMIALFPLVIWALNKWQWRRWLRTSLGLLVVFVLVAGPWMVRNTQLTGSPLYFLNSLKGSVWKNRYLPQLLPDSQPTLKDTLVPAPTGQVPQIAEEDDEVRSKSPVSSAGFTVRLAKVGFSVVNHSLHNFIATMLILPTSPLFHDLARVIEPASPNSLWDAEWDGQLSSVQLLLILVNLMIIAIGLGVSWQTKGFAGWMPFLVYLVYNLATAAARTSGGRYIVPAEWGLYFYYAVGLVAILFWIIKRLKRQVEEPQNLLPEHQPASRLPVILALVSFGLVGLGVGVTDRLTPLEYPPVKRLELVDRFNAQGVFKAMGYDVEQVKEYIRIPGAWITYGRLIYPRYLDKENDPLANELFNDLPKDSSHLVFRLLRYVGVWNYYVPLDSAPASFPDNVSVMVLGCESGHYMEVKAMAILYADGSFSLPITPRELTCPATQ